MPFSVLCCTQYMGSNSRFFFPCRDLSRLWCFAMVSALYRTTYSTPSRNVEIFACRILHHRSLYRSLSAFNRRLPMSLSMIIACAHPEKQSRATQSQRHNHATSGPWLHLEANPRLELHLVIGLRNFGKWYGGDLSWIPASQMFSI